MRVAVDSGGVLETTGPEAVIAITLPPQHLGETVLEAVEPFSTREARRAATSELVFRPPHLSRVPLTAAGLLEALRASVLVGDPGTASGLRTTVELPYGLTSHPVGADGGGVIGDHAATPVVSPSGTVGLWWSRLRAVTATAGDAGLLLAEVKVRPHMSDPDPLPLSELTRERIAAESSHGPLPRASRLDVTSLGGSLAAQGAWETADWTQEVELGRDQRVRFLTSGVLYPLGHRAVYVESAERVLDSAPAVAALRVHRTLIVTEPVLLGVEGDARLARSFPFDEVEITTRTFADLAEPRKHERTRDAIALAAIRIEREQRVADKMAILPLVEAEAVRFRSEDELGIAEVGQAALVDADIAARADTLAADQAVRDQADGLIDRITALQDQIDHIQSTTIMDADGTPSEVIRELEEQMGALQQTLNGLNAPSPRRSSERKLSWTPAAAGVRRAARHHRGGAGSRSLAGRADPGRLPAGHRPEGAEPEAR